MKTCLLIFVALLSISLAANSGVNYAISASVVNGLKNVYAQNILEKIIAHPNILADRTIVRIFIIDSFTFDNDDLSITLQDGIANVALSKFNLQVTAVPKGHNDDTTKIVTNDAELKFDLSLGSNDEGNWHFKASNVMVRFPSVESPNPGFLQEHNDALTIERILGKSLATYLNIRLGAVLNDLFHPSDFLLPLLNHTTVLDYSLSGATVSPSHVSLLTAGLAHPPDYEFSMPDTVTLPEYDSTSNADLQYFFSSEFINSVLFSTWVETYYKNISSLTQSLPSNPLFALDTGAFSVNVPGPALKAENPDLRLTCNNRGYSWLITGNTKWATNITLACVLEVSNGVTWYQTINIDATANLSLVFTVGANNAINIRVEKINSAYTYKFRGVGLDNANVKNQIGRMFNTIFGTLRFSIDLPPLPHIKLKNAALSLHLGYVQLTAGVAEYTSL
jgi:hypothetical protein